MSEKQKIALITGVGKGGIGYGVARAFLKAGWQIAITGRGMDKLEQTAQALRTEIGGCVLPMTADGSVEAEVQRAIAQTVGHYGRLDVVINNAQASTPGLQLVEHTEKDIDLAVRSGLYAAFFYMKHAYPHLKAARGAVINFASGAGLFGKPGQSAYAAAKEAIRGLSRAAATEWGPDGIRVNVICPLVMTAALEKWKAENPALFAQAVSSIPMGRFGDPEADIGRVCLFLASEEAAYLTGETLVLQGGSGLRP